MLSVLTQDWASADWGSKFMPVTEPTDVTSITGKGIRAQHDGEPVHIGKPALFEDLAGAKLPTALLDENQLRALPWPAGGTRSAYDAAGLVPGSERGERWLFWPMGIASAGQMRQWGRHATAFVGRRHFDDPGLLDLYFEPRPPRAAGD